MSAKFGLDWKQYEAVRMKKMTEMTLAEIELQKREIDALKPEGKTVTNQKFR